MSLKHLSSRSLLIAGWASMFIFAGCGSRIAVTSSDSELSLTDRQTGDVLNAGENATIPDTFPQDIPRYPNATKTSLALKNTGDNSYQTSQNTGDDVPAVYRWLETFYQSKGLRKTTDIGDDSARLVDFEDASTRIHFQIARDQKNGYTNILMVRTPNAHPTP